MSGPTTLTLIRADFPGWLGYDVYLDNQEIGHVKRRVGGREWAWTTPGIGVYVGLLPRRQDAVDMLLDADEATR
jgi:hypothetical protein